MVGLERRIAEDAAYGGLHSGINMYKNMVRSSSKSQIVTLF